MEEQKITKIDLAMVISWLVGIILAVIGLAFLAKSVFSGILFLIAACIAIPPVNKAIEKKLKVSLSKGIKFVVVVILVIAGFAVQGDSKKIDSTQNNSTASENVSVSESQKSYQQIFTFSGNGAKKSEPFTITGSRFKIKYDCKGDLCQAFVYKSSSGMPQIIMNSGTSVKDETIIYGAGEYYIDANTMGSYTMTVEDYK